MRFPLLILLLAAFCFPFKTFAQVTGDDITTNEDTPVVFSVIGNDTHVDGIDASSVDLDTDTPGKQTFISTVEGDFSVDILGDVTFTPVANFNGTVTRNYRVDTSLGVEAGTALITITVNSVNDLPTAGDDGGTTPENTVIDVPVLANDADIDGTLDASSIDLDQLIPGIQSINVGTGGVWEATGGQVRFTPILAFNGTATTTYTVNDNEGGTSNLATITVQVLDVNSPPVAVNDAGSTTEDIPVVIDLLANDTDDTGLDLNSVDINTSLAGIQNTLTTAEGNFSVIAGVLTFTPTVNFSGTVSINYTVQDIQGVTSNEAAIDITVTAVNDVPVAVADSGTTNEDTAINLNVVANDTDPDGTIDATSVDLNITVPGIQNTRSTGSGNFSVNASGVVTFTPTPNFAGLSVIEYTVNDNQGQTSNSTTISITVNAVNDSPVANADAITTSENTAVSINVVSNDTDDNAINTATVDLDPSTGGIQTSLTLANGTFTVNSSGVVTFSPSADFFGTVTASYTVNDNEGATSNTATITITVTSVNDRPVANNDAVTTTEDTPVTFNVTSNDTDDGTINAATVDLNVTLAGIQNSRTVPEGTFTADAAGNVTYTPTANFSGSVTVRYSVNDNEGATSDPAQIVVTVNTVNDKPVAVADSRVINEDNSVAVNVVANDTDVDGTINPATVDLDPGTPGIQTSRSLPEGTFTADAAGVVTFVPANNFFGSVALNYTVNDNAGLTSDPVAITITVNSINDAPIANNDVANISQGQVATFNVVTNDIDVDGTINAATVDLDPVTAGIQNTRTIAAIGTYTVNASGVVTFTPLTTFSGTSSITYTVQDNAATTSNAATISVLVNFVNQAPTANDDAITTTEDVPISFSVVANDTDDGTINTGTVDLNTATSGVQSTITTASGTFTVNGSGVVTFTPALNFNGTATTTYTVNDNIGVASNVANITVTINPANDAPVAVNDAATTVEDTPVIIDVVANDTDPDGKATLDATSVDLDPSTAGVDRSRTVPQGTFTANETSGAVTFTPLANFNGASSVTYLIRDSQGLASNIATISVTVSNVNDPPVFDVIADQRVLRNAAAKTITITGISPGPGESESLIFSAVSLNTSLIPHPSISYAGTGTTATLTFKPQLNQSGTADVTVKVIDAGLNEFSRTFRITVVNVVITSTPPILAEEGSLYEYNIETSEVTETLSLVAVQKPTWTTLTSTGKNKAKLSGTPPPGSTTSTVIIQLRDGVSVIDEQQYVLRVNRRPSATPFGMQTDEDVAVFISADKFLTVYTDADADPLAEVRFTTLPKHGTLLLGSAPITADQTVPVASLGSVAYQPEANYNGKDTLYFRLGDSYSFSNPPTYIHFVINPVNDPPLITFVETEPMSYDIGLKLAQNFTTQFTAIEVEGENIVSAEISFVRPNFDPIHDFLEFSNTSNIKGFYDENAGILSLSGSATVAEYEAAIRSIKYNFVDLSGVDIRAITKQARTLNITLNDASGKSEAKQRVINLIFDFVDLKIPNVFTPDGNGSHEVWPFVDDSGVEPYRNAAIRIFDQRGRLVFETVGFNSPWNGKVEGKDVPVGTYFYIIDLKYGDITYNGSVTILRATQ